MVIDCKNKKNFYIIIIIKRSKLYIMTNSEKFFLLFSDSFFTNLAIDTSSEIVIHAMKIFGGAETLQIILVASCGYLLAVLANYLLGKIIFKAVTIVDDKNKDTRFSNIDMIKNFKYLRLILLLSAVPFFGKFIALFAGFCNIGLFRTILYCVIAKVMYYSYLMLS